MFLKILIKISDKKFKKYKKLNIILFKLLSKINKNKIVL